MNLYCVTVSEGSHRFSTSCV